MYALELAKRGARVVVNDLGGAPTARAKAPKKPADQVIDEIQALGGEAVSNHDNVATVAGGENIVKTHWMLSVRSIILINNAGILRDKTFLKMEPENWQAVLDVHLSGAFNVSRPAFGVMKEKGYGRILMTTSAAGLYGILARPITRPPRWAWWPDEHLKTGRRKIQYQGQHRLPRWRLRD